MNKHTPGPWEVLHSETLDTYAVAHASRCSVPLAIMRKDSLEDGRFENAQLISAAPDLLDAAKLAIKVIRLNDPNTFKRDEESSAAYVKLRAAINKAEGAIAPPGGVEK